MGYKSKKINRTKYLKNLSLKTQSKKKIYGGDINPNPNVNSTKASFKSNMYKISNLVVSAIATAVANNIQSIGTKYGINPNKPASETIKELSDNVTKIKNALNSPEGENLKKELGELIADNFDVIKPSITEAEEILLEGINKVSKTINGIISTALNEIPPIFALTEMSKFATAAAQTGEAFTKLTTTGVNVLSDIQKNKDKANIFIKKMSDLVNNIETGVNKKVDEIITSSQNKLDNLVNVEPVSNQSADNFNQSADNFNQSAGNSNQTADNFNQSAGNSNQTADNFKQIMKERNMVGGRINKTLLEFLSPHKSKWKTKHRNNYMRKLESRRR
jgi:ABC-type transporter Mla subunit MlaD